MRCPGWGWQWRRPPPVVGWLLAGHPVLIDRRDASSSNRQRLSIIVVHLAFLVLLLSTCLLQPLCTYITILYVAYNLIVPIYESGKFVSYFCCLLQPLCTYITILYLAYNLIVPNVPDCESDIFSSYFCCSHLLREISKDSLDVVMRVTGT